METREEIQKSSALSAQENTLVHRLLLASKRPTVYSSNCLEQLANLLAEQLFQKGGDPFEKKVVILPSHSLKLYLSSFFANHPRWGICAGISFKTLLNGALDLCQEGEFFRFPSPLALSFAVEQEILQIVENELESPIFAEMKAYLTPLTDQKVIWLSEEVSRFFYEYSTLEAEALKKWKTQKGWKQILWDRVFGEEAHWKCLTQEIEKKEFTVSFQLHLFGFAYIPSCLYQFFCRRGAQIYFLSPSACFWEDLCSDQERIYLEKKMEGKKVRLQVQEQMAFFLQQAPPLLANWGRVGRTLLRQLGDTEAYLEELYIDPLERAHSALTYLQNSFFHLENEKRELSLEDRSILCISATSKLREVEALLETLHEYVLLNSEIEPKDILILSPNLEPYIPYIQMVFGSQESRLNYSIHGISVAMTEERFQALEALFSLSKKRFDLRAVLLFFSFPSVMNQFGWKEDDLKEMETWFEKAHILWGLDPNHALCSLDQTWPENAFKGDFSTRGTWEEGFDRLLQGLAMDLEPFASSLKVGEIINPWPLTEIDWAQSELLGQCIHVLNSLKEDLKVVYQQEKQSIEKWTKTVQKWVSTYFEKSRVEEALIQDLESLKKELEGRTPFPISFESFQRAVKAHFQRKKESFQSANLNTVKFLSMELGASHPSKIICALGCDEGAFPRTRPPSCFEERSLKKEVPSLIDQDRYLFLEMILHAREAFICSYQRMSWKDQKQQGPSLLIQDLLNYLDRDYYFSSSDLKPSKVFTCHHPVMSFDRRYFQGGELQSFSRAGFTSARSYYSSEKKHMQSFFSPLEDPKAALKQSIDRFDLRRLQDFAKDPLKFYCKETLGVFFDRQSAEEEEFFLTPLSKAIMKKEAFQKGLSFALARARAKGEIPLGEVGSISSNDLEERLEKWQKNLEIFGIGIEDLFQLELSAGVREKKGSVGRVILPPVTCMLSGAKEVSVTGNIEFVSKQGFLWVGKVEKIYWPSLFPVFLVLANCADLLGVKKQCLLLETGKVLTFPLEEPQKHLASYLELYKRALTDPCPIRPDWALDFLTKTKEELEKKKKTPFQFKGFIDPYEEWISKRGDLFDIDQIYNGWKGQWEEVFSPLLSGTVGASDGNI